MSPAGSYAYVADWDSGLQIFPAQCEPTSSVELAWTPPSRLALLQNTPNPFNPSTTIGFELPEAAHVTLRIYDVSGSMVRSLVSNRLTDTFHTVEWDGRDDHGREVESGVYYYKLKAGARSVSRSMVLLR